MAACRECRVDQRRGVGAAADVGVADGRRVAVRAGERDLPGPERPVGVRDLRRRLIAGEPAEVRAADADAGQDPAVVLLAPCVQDAGADADGEHEAQERTRCRSGGRATACSDGVPERAGPARRRLRRRTCWSPPALRGSRHRRRRPRWMPRLCRRLVRERRQPDRLRRWAIRASDTHAGWAGAGSWSPGSRDIFACARESVTLTIGSAGGSETLDALDTLRWQGQFSVGELGSKGADPSKPGPCLGDCKNGSKRRIWTLRRQDVHRRHRFRSQAPPWAGFDRDLQSGSPRRGCEVRPRGCVRRNTRRSRLGFAVLGGVPVRGTHGSATSGLDTSLRPNSVAWYAREPGRLSRGHQHGPVCTSRQADAIADGFAQRSRRITSATACSPGVPALNPSIVPSISDALRFWVSFSLASIRAIRSSRPTIARACVRT